MKPRVLPQITAAAPRPNFPLSTSQRHWFSASHDFSNHSKITLALTLKGHLNVRALETALNQTISGNEILRTRYRRRLGEYAQVVEPASSFELATMSLRDLSEEEQAEAMWMQMKREFDRKTDPSDLPLHLTLYERGPQDFMLGGFIHHIAFDGISASLFWRDVFQNYRAVVLGLKRTPTAKLQYKDFAVWENGWLADGQQEIADEFWRERLGEFTIQGMTNQAENTNRAEPGFIRFKIDGDLFDRCTRLARRTGTTLSSLVMTALGKTLLSVDQSDTAIGRIVHARPPKLHDSIGCFMQIRGLVFRQDPRMDFQDALEQVHLEAGRSSSIMLPLSPDIADSAGVGQVLVNYMIGPGTDHREPQPTTVLGLQIRHHYFDPFQSWTTRRLQVSVIQRSQQLDCKIVYAKPAWDHALAANFADAVRGLLASATDE